MPRLESCYFRQDVDRTWGRLARVLAWSARQHCPGWTIHVTPIQPPPVTSIEKIRSVERNTQKLWHWRDLVAGAAEGEQLLLIDVDTMVLRPLDPIWDQPFDLAYTVKRAKFPFNAGVVFVRVSDRTRAFFQAWAEENDRLLVDVRRQQQLRLRFGGINQTALGILLEQASDVFALKVPCLEWNCEDSSWEKFDPSVTRIVHIKGELRHAVFNGSTLQAYAPLMRLWRGYEGESTREVVSA